MNFVRKREILCEFLFFRIIDSYDFPTTNEVSHKQLSSYIHTRRNEENMFDLSLRTAKVISIDDPDKQGKIQISIESVSDGWNKDLLPWAIPLISNVADGTMEMHLPKEGSQIWVLVEKYYKRFYYISNRYFYNLFDFSNVSGLLDKCDKIDTEYKNIDFKYYLDGTLLFHNNSDGSSGIITSQGTLMYIDKEGTLVKEIEKDEKITIKGNKEETIKGKENIEINGQSSTTYKNKRTIDCKSSLEVNTQSSITIKAKTPSLLEIGNTITTLGYVLAEICQDLSSLQTVGSPANHTSPTLTSQMLALLPKIKSTFK